jgi:hypothetical protein
MATITITIRNERNRLDPSLHLARASAVPLNTGPLTKFGLTLSAVNNSITADYVQREIVLLTTPFFDSAFPDDATAQACVKNWYAGEHEIALRGPITWTVLGPVP